MHSRETWEWLKPRLADGFINAVMTLFVTGMAALIFYGIAQVFVGDLRQEKMKIEVDNQIKELKTSLNAELTDLNNNSVKREGELLERIWQLNKKLDHLQNIPTLPNVPSAPVNSETPDPSQHRLEWMNKYVKEYKKKD